MKRLAFSDDMMRAIAAGEKTMTRRPEKRAVPPEAFRVPMTFIDGAAIVEITNGEVFTSVDSGWLKPRFNVGDLVAATCAYNDGVLPPLRYRFNHPDLLNGPDRWNPARIMPAFLAPFVLRITSFRSERLVEITDSDACDEGMLYWIRFTHLFPDTSPRDVFAAYWDKLYGNDAFERDAESWVWVYGFEIAERRIS